MDESFLTTLGWTSLIFRTPNLCSTFLTVVRIQPKALMCFFTIAIECSTRSFHRADGSDQNLNKILRNRVIDNECDGSCHHSFQSIEFKLIQMAPNFMRGGRFFRLTFVVTLVNK